MQSNYEAVASVVQDTLHGNSSRRFKHLCQVSIIATKCFPFLNLSHSFRLTLPLVDEHKIRESQKRHKGLNPYEFLLL